jgi:peptidoglycan/LPS O-acetylase OafA/YrhL
VVRAGGVGTSNAGQPVLVSVSGVVSPIIAKHTGTPIPMNPRRVFGLDVLRATAISAVVLGHGFGLLALLGSPTFAALGWTFQFFGVELFFVLSGYLIGGILLKRQAAGALRTSSDLLQFWRRRWMRTLPNYYLILLILVGGAAVLHTPTEFSWRYLVFLQNFTSPHPAFFPVAWSLAVEEWFYLIIPVAVCMFGHAPAAGDAEAKRLGVVFVVLLLLFTTVRVLYVIINDPTFDEGTRKVVLVRLDSVLMGVNAAFIARHYRDLWVRWRWHVFGAGLALLAVVEMLLLRADLNSSFLCRTALFSLTSLGCAGILPVCSEWRECRSWLGSIVRFIAVISYSLYLCHFSLGMGLLGGILSLVPGLLVVAPVMYILVNVGVAAMLYYAFERPILNLRDRPRRAVATTPPA